MRTTHRSCPLNPLNIDNYVEESQAPDPVFDQEIQPNEIFDPLDPELDDQNRAPIKPNPVPETPNPVPETPNPVPDTPKLEPETPKPAFRKGDNVLARWKPRQWFHAHVTHVGPTEYTVYFMDGNVKTVPYKHVRQYDGPKGGATAVKCADVLNCIFFSEADPDLAEGNWKVRSIDWTNNTFRCLRESGQGPINSMDFDVGFVMRSVRLDDETNRERGPVRRK